jgi:hypothetical protein
MLAHNIQIFGHILQLKEMKRQQRIEKYRKTRLMNQKQKAPEPPAFLNLIRAVNTVKISVPKIKKMAPL